MSNYKYQISNECQSLEFKNWTLRFYLKFVIGNLKLKYQLI